MTLKCGTAEISLQLPLRSGTRFMRWSQSSDLQCDNVERASESIDHEPAIGRAALDLLRTACGISLLHRHLWTDVLCGNAADKRDWHSHGARSRTLPCALDGDARDPFAGGPWHCRRRSSGFGSTAG